MLQEKIEAGIIADLILEDTARAVASARAETMRRRDVHKELLIEHVDPRGPGDVQALVLSRS